MRITTLLSVFILALLTGNLGAQTIPNNDMETWINHGQYDDPQFWDTPNQEVCFLPFYSKVVTKSSDHQSGSFSARLETKLIPIINITVPGVVTLGTLSINVVAGTYAIKGGVPINDKPTHLKGYFKYQPKGGDSCAIGIMLTKWMGSHRDTIGTGVFSTHDTITSWTQFSAWIDYTSSATPDTMNILAISSASYTPAAGTILFVDGFFLDYTTSVNREDPSKGIGVFNDRDLRELMVSLDFPSPEETSVRIYNSMGQSALIIPSHMIDKERMEIRYDDFNPGLFVLEIIHGNKKFCRKFIFNL